MAGHVSLKVYDMLGKEVKILVDEHKTAGVYNTQFNIGNSQLSSGVYLYKLESSSLSLSKKLVLIK
jgi:hypothetical protein